MSIQERQNQPDSIEKLAAQRLLYSRAKKKHHTSMALIVLVAILGLAASVVENEEFNKWVPLFALVAWTVDQFVLKRIESTFKTEAATIQEDFDCFVLDLQWPVHKGILRPTLDRVKQLAAAATSKQKGSKGLVDWYTPNAIPQDCILSKIHCQRMNCWWDVNLRLRWNKVLCWGIGIFVLVALILGVGTGIAVVKFIAIVASCIRVFAWGLAEVIDQIEAVRRISGLHRHLSNLTDPKQVSPRDIRSIQDEIFEHRRSNSPVPDWIYRWNRDDQELEAATPQNR